mmetsp:Transcript_28082/g.47477  ORF Transcript_28082/g.47477 Transcript_28082/m.47477 type:complete len:300 (-) Transcript_28082:145-1044(-)|eukprot:CAMPEP_0114429062 /NCGR_PEP_ID=MMETSP0103-20121206/9272_1 /TAXON_ID=37642 ORGANISM="Paraphysomonas imperforata, Strain PA2" /NCGR_SAMPLE_ID=MMETSP0103 /ASSEMBLY_ACC=CAM_ASM_000201 /LENGTH=299 /DNA_ID=CAMNT_0001598347 /DNA_START=73 /DNA_END=972 /DNA_ORIENTATION=-
MQTDIQNSPELEMLFDLFNEDFCEDFESQDSADSPTGEDISDDTSSESSGSSGRSSLTSTSMPSPQHISTYYPTPPSVVFAANPLSSFVSSNSSNDDDAPCSNKRTKTEDKLMRNRESANKSRLKRKNEKLQLEETVAALQERVRTLEMENTALLTDNTTLSQHNFFLQSMLKKQQDDSSTVVKSEAVSRPSHMSALSGISMLCVVFSISFFNEWLPSSLQAPADSGGDSYSIGDSSGRVLLSVDDDDYSSSSYVYMDRSQQPQVALHYVFLVGAMFVYYFYIQRCKAAEKEQSRVLPS